jgi:Tocopherol cyclase
MRWERQPGHYEVWYATFSHLPSQTGYWIRYTLESPKPGHGTPYAELWFARFDPRAPERTFGFHRRTAIAELKQDNEPWRLRIGDAELRDDGMKGALAGAGHAVSWDLRWQPSPTVHRHLPDMVYRGTWADTQVVAPHLNVAAHGHVIVDGERVELDAAPLGQSHVWGRKHAYSWAWSHCNAFEGDRGAALETLTVRLRRGSVVLPKLTMLTLRLDGSEPDLVEFRDFWKMPLARSEYGTGRYHLLASGAEFRVEAELTCRAEDMLLTEYVDPDGDPAFCHNTECADARVVVHRRSPFVGRFREWRTLRSARGAHFEWGARAGDPMVKKRHILVDDR